MKKNKQFLFIFLCFCYVVKAQNIAKPTQRQLDWQSRETTAFLHFTVNTFTDKEWGDGTESPSIFNPTAFDARKIVQNLKKTGFKLAIITAKHHDGFCLWHTKMTEHSVKNSPFKRDVVRELSDACQAEGLKFGVYLSPWDRHEPTYGTPQYNAFYKAQLTELLTQYGDIHEVWFDGAKGENAKDMTYDFAGYWALVRQLQPKAVMFSDVGPDVRWVGNESGNAGETCWSTLTVSQPNTPETSVNTTINTPINTQGKAIAPGIADEKYLNTGDPNGTSWIPAETDVSIRKGWFYHESEDKAVKTGRELVNLYYKSVGRNSLLLLNIPPNRSGLLAENDVVALTDFHSILSETFEKNLAEGHVERRLTDKKLATSIPLGVGQSFVIDFKKDVTFDRFLIQENIAEGQRIEKARLEYWQNGAWQALQDFTTVGYKRLLRFEKITTPKLRLTILAANRTVFLSEIGCFKASERE
jgi:alpha-L-fucosidase